MRSKIIRSLMVMSGPQLLSKNIYFLANWKSNERAAPKCEDKLVLTVLVGKLAELKRRIAQSHLAQIKFTQYDCARLNSNGAVEPNRLDRAVVSRIGLLAFR